MPVVMGLADRLAEISLEDAQVSEQADKLMIDEFVRTEKGGFDKMNKLVRLEIRHVWLVLVRAACISVFPPQVGIVTEIHL